MNNINETMTHPQNGAVNQFSGYGAPQMEDFAATTPTGQGVNMGTGPVMGDPEKGDIATPMVHTGDKPMAFRTASSDPSGFPLPHNQSHSEFTQNNQLESQPDAVVNKITVDKVIQNANKQIY